MGHSNEIGTFRAVLDSEAESTIRLLEALPKDQYEIDACLSFGIVEGRFSYRERSARSAGDVLRWP